MTETKRFLADPQTRMVAEWALRTMTAVALAIGAWFFAGLTAELKELREVIGDLKTKVQLMDRDRKVLDDHEDRLRALERER